MTRAYESHRALTGEGDARERLVVAQKAWEAYRDGHLHERFPHYQTDPMYYGSVGSMCLSNELRALAVDRLRELERGSPCDGRVPKEQADAAARDADAALNVAYRKVRALYAPDAPFLASFEDAQKTWLRYRDAEVAFLVAENRGADPACAARAVAPVVRARTTQIEQWLKPQEEGDVCAGSFGPP